MQAAKPAPHASAQLPGPAGAGTDPQMSRFAPANPSGRGGRTTWWRGSDAAARPAEAMRGRRTFIAGGRVISRLGERREGGRGTDGRKRLID